MTFQKWPQARICIHSRFHCEGQKIKPLTSRMKDGCATCSNTIATYTSHCTLQQYLHITHNMMSLKVLVGSSQPMWFHIYDILYKISNALKVHLLSATSDICAVCETDLVKTKWSSLLTYTCMVLCCIQSRGILNTTLWTLFWFYWKWLWCSLNLLLMAWLVKHGLWPQYEQVSSQILAPTKHTISSTFLTNEPLLVLVLYFWCFRFSCYLYYFFYKINLETKLFTRIYSIKKVA